MDKRLPHFQVYKYGKTIVKFVKNYQYTIKMWCEQYIECVINIFSHLINKPHMKIWHLIYIYNHFLIITNYY